MAAEKECRVVLVGMMGSGKSTIGHELARRTGWPYHDNDVLLERNRGLTARELLAEGGEVALRAAEAETLEAGLQLSAPCIIGAPAGTITDQQCRRRLAANGLVVWLRASPAILAGRAAGAAHRPWLDGDAVAWMKRVLDVRDGLYESVADHVVETDGRSPAEVAADIVARLREEPRCAAVANMRIRLVCE